MILPQFIASLEVESISQVQTMWILGQEGDRS